MDALAEVLPPNSSPMVAITPMAMLNQAVAQGANVEVLAKLMDLHERWERGQQRKAFDEAIAAAKAEIPVIIKNRQGHNSKRYADFAAIASVVDPIISKHGLSYRFRTRQDERIHVTCILSHQEGHYEENTLAGHADNTGNKNAIQSIGSTLTYLQRYSLTQALGLAASDDDDAHAAGIGETLTEDQIEKIQSLIVETGTDIKLFLAYFKAASIPEMPAAKYASAVTMLEKKLRATA